MSRVIDQEKWDIFKFDTEYLISSYGRVYKISTKEFIRPSIHKSRANYYLRICINNKRYMLHVIVALHFVNNFAIENTEVDHLDGNTLNPAAYNLDWVTPSTNKYRMHERRFVNILGFSYKGTYRKIIIKNKSHKQ